MVGWPSGLRRQFQALVSSEAWVRIPLQSLFFFFIYLYIKTQRVLFYYYLLVVFNFLFVQRQTTMYFGVSSPARNTVSKKHRRSTHDGTRTHNIALGRSTLFIRPRGRVMAYADPAAHHNRHLGRVVKAVDSKSTGLCPRRFESGRCRILLSVLLGEQRRGVWRPRAVGLEVWFSLWVRQAAGSMPARPPTPFCSTTYHRTKKKTHTHTHTHSFSYAS